MNITSSLTSTAVPRRQTFDPSKVGLVVEPAIGGTHQQQAKPSLIGTDAFAGLRTTKEGSQALDAVTGMISGEAAQPGKTATQMAMSRAAQNLRNTATGYMAPKLGQGSALQAQHDVEKDILAGVAATKVQQSQDEQAMRERGVGALQGLAQTGMEMGQYETEQWKQQWNDTLTTTDPSTQEGLTRLQDIYEQRYGFRPDMNTLMEERNYLKTKREQDLDSYNWEKEKWQQSFGLETAKFEEMTRQFNLTTDEGRRQFNEKLKLDWESLDQQDRQFFESLGFDREKWSDTKSQWQQSFEFTKSQWAEDLKFKYDGLRSNEALTREGIISEEKISGMKISSDEKIAGMQIASAEKIAQDRNYLEQQGIDLQKASLYGYTRPDGTYVPGQLDIAAERLGIDKMTAQSQISLAERNFGLDSEKFIEAKRQALASEKLEGDKLQVAKDQFAQTFGLEVDKFNEDTRRWEAEQKTEDDRWMKEFGLREDELADKKEQWRTQLSKQDEWNTRDMDIKESSLEMERWYRGEEIGIKKAELDLTTKTVQNDLYWAESDKFQTYATTHLDATDEQKYQAAAGWYKAQTGKDANLSDPKFQAWAKSEWSAATDKRLTNPFEETMYLIRSSSLPKEVQESMIAGLQSQFTDGAKFETDDSGNPVFLPPEKAKAIAIDNLDVEPQVRTQKGANNDAYEFAELTSAYNNKTLLKINGEYWQVQGMSQTKINFADNSTTYTLYNPDTKKTATVYAGSKVGNASNALKYMLIKN